MKKSLIEQEFEKREQSAKLAIIEVLSKYGKGDFNYNEAIETSFAIVKYYHKPALMKAMGELINKKTLMLPNKTAKPVWVIKLSDIENIFGK